MQHVPSADDMRTALRALPPIDAKVVGGLATLLVAEPQRARDQEWLAEQFTGLAVLAHGFAGEGASTDDVETVQRYARARHRELVGRALQLFVRTAQDLQARGTPFAFADARAVVLDYVGADNALPLDEG